MQKFSLWIVGSNDVLVWRDLPSGRLGPFRLTYYSRYYIRSIWEYACLVV